MKSKMLKTAAMLLACAMTVSLMSSCGAKNNNKEENGITDVTDEMYSASFWTEKYKKSDKALLTADEIMKYNMAVTDACSGMEDITAFPTTLTGVQLRKYLDDCGIETLRAENLADADGEVLNIPMVYGADGEPVSGNGEFLDKMERSFAEDEIYDSNDVNYAVAGTNTSLRRLPTDVQAFRHNENNEDVIRIKNVNIGEPMLVLHENRDGDWVFVQTREARGWVERGGILEMEKGLWLNYIRADKFVVVTEPSITITAQNINSEPITLYMGTVLPLTTIEPVKSNDQSTYACHVVRLPMRNDDGVLAMSELLIPKNAGVSLGWLKYTPENITELALKFVGHKLNPAGINNGWDSGSFYAAVFRCFGIYLPLTVDEQRSVPGTCVDLGLESVDGKKKQLDGLYPGTLIYSDNSAFLYLGQENGKNYILHPAEEFFVNNSRFVANCIIVTNLDIMRSDGATYMNSMKVIKKLVPDTAK